MGRPFDLRAMSLAEMCIYTCVVFVRAGTVYKYDERQPRFRIVVCAARSSTQLTIAFI